MARRFRRSWRREILVGLGLLGLIVARVVYDRVQPREPEVLGEGEWQVARVVDGDTLLLANQARVRLQGIDAPESVRPDHPVEPWGREASDFTRQFVEGGRVRLQFDRERRDQYGRFLAYVWVGPRMLNEELLRAGLAEAKLGYHYSESMKRRFRTAQEEAQRAGRGIWSDAP